jgi:putative PIN family toxin of toxin-antitoxin system
MTISPILILDTNVVLALWHFADPALVPLTHAIAADRVILTSRDDAVEELRLVLAYPQFGIAAATQAEIFAHYRARLNISPSALIDAPELPRCRDADDQKFLEIAATQNGSYLLTRDRLLLKLARHRLLRERFHIMTPERFQAENLGNPGYNP